MNLGSAVDLIGQTVVLSRAGEPNWRRMIVVVGLARVGEQWFLKGSDGQAYDVARHDVTQTVAR